MLVGHRRVAVAVAVAVAGSDTSSYNDHRLGSIISVPVPVQLGIDNLTIDNVTSYSTKLRNPTQVATMTTALDLGVI
jgi:hypothetical protein